MANRRMLWTMVVVAVLTSMAAVSVEAQQNVASVSKRGSLLVFPFIYTGNGQAFDTIVQIGNDAAQPVTLKCYWMDLAQNAWDFEFTLTAYQPVWFSAKTGLGSIDVSPFGPELEGELKCWAIDRSTDPESVRQFNYLYGTAMLLPNPDFTFFSTLVFEYNAWAFALRGIPADPSGPLTLNGSTDYDACPSYLTYNFFAAGTGIQTMFSERSWLALSPCRQDLRQDRTPICTKAKFDVWNENESKFTGAYQCIKCTSWAVLENLGDPRDTWGGCDLPKCKPVGFGGDKFIRSVLHSNAGRFRVTPSSFPACAGVFAHLGQDGKTVVDECPAANQYQTPFIGVMMTEEYIWDGQQDYVQQLVGSPGHGVGAWTGPQPIPQILWDAGTGTALSPERN